MDSKPFKRSDSSFKTIARGVGHNSTQRFHVFESFIFESFQILIKKRLINIFVIIYYLFYNLFKFITKFTYI